MANKSALGSRPKSEYEKKLVGIVEIKTGNDTAKITLLDEGKTFKGGSDTIKVKIKDLPREAQRVIKPGMTDPKPFRIRMNQDGDAVEAVTPVRGTFKAKLTDLGPRKDKDADPVPYERIFGEGTEKENSHLEFFAVYEIIEGAFKGVQLPAYYLHYKFEEDPNDEGMTRFAGNIENKKATRLHQLYEWGTVHNLYEEPIRWPDDGNILPELLERAEDSDVEVNLVIDKGYIIAVQLPENYEVVEDDDDVEEPAPKKSSKKSEPVEETEDEFDEKFPAKKPAASKSSTKKPAKKSSADDDDDDL